MKMLKSMKRSPDAADANAGAGDAGVVTKAEFEKLHNQFAEFTDLVTKNFLEKEDMRNANQPPVIVPPVVETPVVNKASDFSEDELAELGFNQKQLSFVNNLAKTVAEKTARTVSEQTFSQASIHVATNDEMARLDQEAYTDFPDLNNKASALYQETDRIMKRMRALDKQADSRPDFLLASAMRAKKELDKRNAASRQNTPDNTERKRFDNFSLEVGSHSSAIGKKAADENVSDERKMIRNLLR